MSGRLSKERIGLFSLSLIGVVVCATGAVAHYLKWAWGNPWQLAGWIMGMAFLLLAFLPSFQQIAARFRSLVSTRTAFFAFWILFFVVSHLWNFWTAPWNGDGLFDESGWDLYFLKHYVIGQPFQAAWFHNYISRETLYHYYLWGFFEIFGFNILSFEAAVFVIWLLIFVFTLLLVDHLFQSNIVTSLAAIIFNFLPFAFTYAFGGYRYPLATLLSLVSLYCLYVGFQRNNRFLLSLGGISGGLCFAAAISGKQYLYAICLSALIYTCLHWKMVKRSIQWGSVAVVVYGLICASVPIICFIVFNREDYTRYEASHIQLFWDTVSGKRPGVDPGSYAFKLWACFFRADGQRFFIPDTLPIPLSYYLFLIPGLVLALWQRHYAIVLLATVPVLGAFVAGATEHRLLPAIPYWIILMAFALAGFSRITLQWPITVAGWMLSAIALLYGLIPSIQYIYKKTTDPLSVMRYSHSEVAVSRYLRYIVAGKASPVPPRHERNEFNRFRSDPPYDTLICPGRAYSIIHLFLHDYDADKILSFCDDTAMFVMTTHGIWSANKKAISNYVPQGKDLKLIWEMGDPAIDRIIQVLDPVGNLTHEQLSFPFAGRNLKFYVLYIRSDQIPEFKRHVEQLPDSV